MRVLVVDDDPGIRSSLRRALRYEGYDVDVASGGAAALARVRQLPEPDVVLLDLGLPDRDGLDVLRELRKEASVLPVLVLTARDAVGDRVLGLDAGADDYLSKPFALEELLARVRALTRRVARTEAGEGRLVAEELALADLVVRPGAHEAVRGGRPLQLTRTEFALLEALLRNAGQVVRREALLERVWGWSSDTLSNGLDVYIGYLRRKLEAGGEPRLIHTVRGVGYMAKA